MSETLKPNPQAPARSRREFVKSIAAGSALAAGLPSALAGERRTMTRRELPGRSGGLLPAKSPPRTASDWP